MKQACDLVVIGASTGGVEALEEVVSKLPGTFAGVVLVVMHVGPRSFLQEILARCSKLPVVLGEENQPLMRGCIYVAPPGSHMRVRDAHISLDHGPRENRHRPAIDPLFRSAARIYRNRVAGVILSGALDDGAAGLFAIKSRGGIAIVQDPETAVCGAMPQNAMKHMTVDYCLPLVQIGPLLARIVGRRSKHIEHIEPPKSSGKSKGSKTLTKSNGEKPGEQTPMSCPECHSPLFIIQRGKRTYFHCGIGHTFAPESLSESHTEALERALWIAVRTLRERMAIQRSLALTARGGTGPTDENRFSEMADNAERDVALLQEILERL